MDKLNKLNYLHAGVALVTTETAQVVQLMEEEAKKLRLKLTETSSSINTEDVHAFNMQMENKIGEGVRVPSPSKVPGSDPESKAWKVLHDTPGVGTYNLPPP